MHTRVWKEAESNDGGKLHKMRRATICVLVCCLCLSTSFSQDARTIKRACGSQTRYNELLKTSIAFKTFRIKLLALTNAYASVRRSGRVAPRTTAIRIPVVVHVIYRTDVENISDDQIQSQIVVLNNDYENKGQDLQAIPEMFRNAVGNPLLKFELAAFDPSGQPTSGITRTKTQVTAFSILTALTETKSSLQQKEV